ncbi:DUF6166 domain-containing protein [Haladaptatus sp. DFWS20]|uniref:DUF6166 domain-containing protein n=1 Tax=Haladaptatus sp. DFWS20 TaxID=3403467 RepID=UPI003EB9923B
MAARVYTAVEDYDGTGRNEILFDGIPIPHVPYTESSPDDFTWGYSGAGPTNVARSILEHALSIVDSNLNVNPADYQIAFREQYVSSQDGWWTVDHAEVIEFVNSRGRENRR